MLRTSYSIDVTREDRAQSTVEAAFLLPTFLTLVLLALQPVCLLYTRAVMESAAAETARLMTTTTVGDDEDIKEFARRRLAAVPDVRFFMPAGPCRGISSLVGPMRAASRPFPLPARLNRCP